MKKNKIIVILGPTSSGKTELAVKLAREFNGEIVSADSRQVYQGLDIGTGKDLKEYGDIPYHLIDVTKPQKQFNLAEYQKLAYKEIDKIIKKHKTPFLVGGSGLYLQSVIDGYDLTAVKPRPLLRDFFNFLSLVKLQQLAVKNGIKLNKSDFKNKRRLIRELEINNAKLSKSGRSRPRYECLLLGLALPKEELKEKIERRLKKMLEEESLILEVKKLRQRGLSWERLNELGLEYRFVAKYLQEELTYQDMFNKLNTAIRQFAKRQMTWFKRDQRIIWPRNQFEAEKLIGGFINCKD